ncbi:cysteine proteinase [Rhizodiscina lignyota]|uniref:Cysteine proteinase n=1 Tax=Rhizodiscina lignyota TaxID=1504668 RepID=A0A9P4I702_9PEZI|nr:cysteine proteinase [Rhizodiscina lignyota]
MDTASNQDEALELAIRAAELCMRALKIATDANDKSNFSSKCRSLLEQAENIKSGREQKPSISAKSSRVPSNANITRRVKRLLEPISTRQQSKAEQILVLRASDLNGFRFPPWKGAPGSNEFELVAGQKLFTDSPDLVLSKHQMEIFDGWMRPKEAIPPPTWPERSSIEYGPTMQYKDPMDVVQDAAADCSVVASLCAATARAARGHPKILANVLYPYDDTNDRPEISPNGKYVVRLNFNGCYRKVTIDDRLPVSKTARILYVVDRKNPSLLWPALLEKAYLKVRGGYVFPGSNPSTDLWILAGWIPEQLFVQDDRVNPCNLWKRIYNAHNYGDVLVNLGTGKMSRRLERDLGLAAQHAYSVLDLKEEDGQRLLLLKNPWVEGTSWRGRSRHQSSTALTGQNGDSLVDGDAKDPTDFPKPHEPHTPGTFWIDLNNIMQHFESIYLSWNPGLFSRRQDVHFAWDLSDANKRGSPDCFVNHPQYAVSSASGGVLWLLLCRHFKNISEPTDDLLDLQETMKSDLSGHISIYAYARNGQRVYTSDGALERGPYVDSPQTLLRLDIPANSTYTIVASEQDLSTSVHTFTLSAFANSPISLEPVTDKYTHSITVPGSWNPASAGGNATSPTYSRNPQFSLTVTSPTSLTLLLETLQQDINVHVKLTHSSGGKRITSTLKRRDILVDSGDYRRQSCVAELEDLGPGTYTIIASTFEPDQIAAFSLRLDSTTSVTLKRLPPENAGRLPLKLAPALFPGSATRIACSIMPLKMLHLSLFVRYINPHPPSNSSQTSKHPLPPLRLSIEIGRGPNRQDFFCSNGGEYDDPAVGIRTGDIDLWPEMRKQGEIMLVLERLVGGAGTEVVGGGEQFAVELWLEGVVDVDRAIQIGKWTEWE